MLAGFVVNRLACARTEHGAESVDCGGGQYFLLFSGRLLFGRVGNVTFSVPSGPEQKRGGGYATSKPGHPKFSLVSKTQSQKLEKNRKIFFVNYALDKAVLLSA